MQEGSGVGVNEGVNSGEGVKNLLQNAVLPQLASKASETQIQEQGQKETSSDEVSLPVAMSEKPSDSNNLRAGLPQKNLLQKKQP